MRSRACISTRGGSTRRSRSFAQSLRLNGESAPTHYNLGVRAVGSRPARRGDRASCSEALRIDPDYAQAHNNLGALLQVAGSRMQALAHYRRAVALRPDNVEARANLGQLLSNRGQVVRSRRPVRRGAGPEA